MYTKTILFLAAFCSQNVFGSHHHGSHGDLRYHGPTAIPHVLHDGHIADTHEVAAAKAEHFAAFAKAHSFEGSYGHEGDYAHTYGGHETFRYHGPTAIPHVLHNGFLADTHEVAAAKSAHLAAKGSHGYAGHYGYGSAYGYNQHYSHDDHGHLRYHGPIAIPHVLHDGHIADTHAVAAAKAQHFAAVAKAKAHIGYGSAYGYGGAYGYSHGDGPSGSHEGHGDLRYHGPTAIPHVLHDGHIADTHEVAAAKAEHFAAVAKAQAHGGYGHDYSGRYAGGYSADHGYASHAVAYHGPTAKPVVLHNGYLADTYEVAAAKEHHLHALHSTYH